MRALLVVVVGAPRPISPQHLTLTPPDCFALSSPVPSIHPGLLDQEYNNHGTIPLRRKSLPPLLREGRGGKGRLGGGIREFLEDRGGLRRVVQAVGV